MTMTMPARSRGRETPEQYVAHDRGPDHEGVGKGLEHRGGSNLQGTEKHQVSSRPEEADKDEQRPVAGGHRVPVEGGKKDQKEDRDGGGPKRRGLDAVIQSTRRMRT